jgi:hypothetical protein
MIGRPFEPGNKMGKGRPPGSRNKMTVFQELLAGNGIVLQRIGPADNVKES